jgi:hypothetical protein
MPDCQRPGDLLGVSSFGERFYPANFFDYGAVVPVDHSYTGRIVATIF